MAGARRSSSRIWSSCCPTCSCRCRTHGAPGTRGRIPSPARSARAPTACSGRCGCRCCCARCSLRRRWGLPFRWGNTCRRCWSARAVSPPSPPRRWRWQRAATGAPSGSMRWPRPRRPLPPSRSRCCCPGSRGATARGCAMAEGLRFEHLTIALGADRLIALDCTVGPGEVLTVMGPSGSGKSTLLAAITGTLDPAFAMTGRIRLDGQDLSGLPTEARRVGILFQDEYLFPHLSVGANLAFGLKPEVRGRAARRARIEAALAEVELAGFADRDPATLSGGQRARVALQRMLLSEPRALLLDEAFSKLDTGLRAQVRALVFDTARHRALPVLQVTHDHSDAEAAGGEVVTVG